MGELFYELFVIGIGRYMFGLTGACVRYAWLRLTGKKVAFSSLWSDRVQDDGPVDNQAFKNRIVGFCFLLGLLIVLLQR